MVNTPIKIDLKKHFSYIFSNLIAKEYLIATVSGLYAGNYYSVI
jgi:hypothetical protein